MFHIKKDVRAQRSAELLYEGLVECMKTKPFDEISILDVSKASAVSRTTFYRNFDSTIDILYWKCDVFFREVITEFARTHQTMTSGDAFLKYVLNYWMGKDEILEVIISHGRTDIIYNIFFNNSDYVNHLISDQMNLPELSEKYFIATRIGMFVGIFQTWIQTGKKETADEIIDILKKQDELSRQRGFMF